MGIGNVGIFIYFKIIDFYQSLLMNLFLTILNIISPFKMTDSDAYKNLNAMGRKRIQVRIENIEDWCIDYTYGNPNLWLISTSGVWYRIAGLLCAGAMNKSLQSHKGFPSIRYQSIYQKTCLSYLTSVHVAMCLLDFLPSSSKLSLQFLCEEIAGRSHGEIDEIDILQNYKFISGKNLYQKYQ